MQTTAHTTLITVSGLGKLGMTEVDCIVAFNYEYEPQTHDYPGWEGIVIQDVKTLDLSTGTGLDVHGRGNHPDWFEWLDTHISHETIEEILNDYEWGDPTSEL